MSIFTLFKRKKPSIINIGDFGPVMSFGDLKASLVGKRRDELFKAVVQLCEFQRQLCQSAVEDKSNTVSGQTQFEAGGAAAMADVIRTLRDLEGGGGDSDSVLRGWFA
jgi:hypothetical protein